LATAAECEDTVPLPHLEDLRDAVARLRDVLLVGMEETSGRALRIKASKGSPELREFGSQGRWGRCPSG
jgi:hypothetical protein